MCNFNHVFLSFTAFPDQSKEEKGRPAQSLSIDQQHNSLGDKNGFASEGDRVWMIGNKNMFRSNIPKTDTTEFLDWQKFKLKTTWKLEGFDFISRDAFSCCIFVVLVSTCFPTPLHQFVGTMT